MVGQQTWSRGSLLSKTFQCSDEKSYEELMTAKQLKEALAAVPDSVEVSILSEGYVPHSPSSLPTVLCKRSQINKPALEACHLKDGLNPEIFRITC